MNKIIGLVSTFDCWHKTVTQCSLVEYNGFAFCSHVLLFFFEGVLMFCLMLYFIID